MNPSPLDIYLIAIGGTGMAPLACLLKEQGHQVRGSDGPLYPPMSTLLEAADIHPLVGFEAAHLQPPPDLVIVGNAVPRSNPEAEAVEASGVERISMPQAVARFLLPGRRPLVVAGTHGKTTTTAIAASVWSACGRDPGYLIGGVPYDLPASFRLGAGDRFIIEGDEYNASYFDRGAKFLHYAPQTLILTSVEYDHADLYPDPDTLLDAYRKLLHLLPEDGLLIAYGDSPAVREIAGEASCRVVFYGLNTDNTIHPLDGVHATPEGSRFEVADDDSERATVRLALVGDHNICNALAVWAAARADGIPVEELATALAGFHGVRRRLEWIGHARDIEVVEDFAHHPTAVLKTLQALAQRYPDRRQVVLFEPRSLTAGRELFHEAYLEAFRQAGHVVFAPAYHAGRLQLKERLDFTQLASELVAVGTEAETASGYDDVLRRALAACRPGDVVISMSSGAFDDMPRRLLAALHDGKP